MEKIELVCTNNNKSNTADVLQKNDKYMKVALEGTQIVIELFRDNLNTSYKGHTAGLEFEWQPKN